MLVLCLLTAFSVTNRRWAIALRSEEHTSELQSRLHLVCRLLLEKKKAPHPRQSDEFDQPAGGRADSGHRALPAAIDRPDRGDRHVFEHGHPGIEHRDWKRPALAA